MYEYISALGDPPKDQIPVTVSAQPVVENSGDRRTRLTTEARAIAQELSSLIARVRSGDQEAIILLRDFTTHHDWQGHIEACRGFYEGRVTDLDIDRQTAAEYCSAINLAVQVAEGNDPQRRRNAMIAAGVGAGALVFAAVAYLILKR